jgi:hypothetical protein
MNILVMYKVRDIYMNFFFLKHTRPSLSLSLSEISLSLSTYIYIVKYTTSYE